MTLRFASRKTTTREITMKYVKWPRLTCDLVLRGGLILVLLTPLFSHAQQSRRPIAPNFAIEYSDDPADLIRSICEAKCETRYYACVLSAVFNLQRETLGSPNTPARAPGKFKLPHCWPYECKEDNDRVPVDDEGSPLPRCEQFLDLCVESCPPRPG